jgi:hypothetical protein
VIQVSATAKDAARRLWGDAVGDADTIQAVVAGAGRVCLRLRAGLVRWIGRDGYHSLCLRALEEIRSEHAWLGSLHCEMGLPQELEAGTRGFPPAKVANGMLALIATLVHLLGRITGEEIAMRLVEDAWAVEVPDDSGYRMTKGTRDG